MLPYAVFKRIAYDLNEKINLNYQNESYMLYNMYFECICITIR